MPFCKLGDQLTLFSFSGPDDLPGFPLQIYFLEPVKIRDPLIEEIISWSSVEHFYHAQKITDKHERIKFINETKNANINECRSKINEFKYQDPNWHLNETKQKVMLQALRAKYAQLPQVKLALDSTANLPIIEDNATAPYEDNVWGCGPDGNGENWLGILWMQVRAEKRDGKNPRTARIEALALQEQAQIELKSLGIRTKLLQDHPNVVAATTLDDFELIPTNVHIPTIGPLEAADFAINATKEALSPSKKYDLLTFARSFLQLTQPGGTSTFCARDSSKINYGHSSTEKNTFFISGTDASGNDIEVTVKNGKIYENGNEVSSSNWASWAIRLIPQKSPILPENARPLLFNHLLPHSENLVESPPRKPKPSFMESTTVSKNRNSCEDQEDKEDQSKVHSNSKAHLRY